MEHDADTLFRAYRTRDPRFDGRVFAGVRTTGIYCRPVCPARLPLRENMTFFPTAAAAQAAGYRPCLRCRPEASPDLAGWRGTSPIVARALALIDEGLLEDAAIDDLAGRVGVSDRQLRRLFREHLGATPVTVAQSRRVLLARQLIGQTDLSMADVAMASGFGSVRRFNETFRQLFGRPPGELRRHRVTDSAGQTVPGTDLTVGLPYRPPYDWDGLLGRLATAAVPGLESVAGDRYVRAVRAGEAVGAIMVGPAGGRNGADRLELTVSLPRLDALPRLIARTRRLLDLPADPDAIGAALAEDPVLAPLVAARPGLRVPGAWDPFERAVRTLLADDPDAIAALVTTTGPPIPDERPAWVGALTHAFPAPADIAGSAGGVRDVDEPVVALAGAVVADPRLFDGDAPRLRDRLGGLPGFGDAMAARIAHQLADETDLLDATDPALLAAAGRAGVPASMPAALADHARRWSPFRTYAAAHLLAAHGP